MKLSVFLVLVLLIVALTTVHAATLLDPGTMKVISGGCGQCVQPGSSCAGAACWTDNGACLTCEGVAVNMTCIGAKNAQSRCAPKPVPGGCGSWVFGGVCHKMFWNEAGSCSARGGTASNDKCTLQTATGGGC